MAFINIFDYKKYFSSKGDSNVARIGHVNKLAARVTSPSTVTQLTNNNTGVTINGYSGVITMQTALAASPTAYSFLVTNSAVTAESTVLISVQYSAQADSTDIVRLGTSGIVDGAFRVNIAASTATTGAVKIHFLVIN
jgi:hypothetical protein